jgi:outer membrane receptor protein involved in Fe transport
MKFLFTFYLLLPLVSFSQVLGVISDGTSNEKIYGVRIQSTDGQNALSDAQGKFTLSPKKYPVQLKFSMNGYVSDSLMIFQDTTFTISLYQIVQEIKTMVVSASRSDQNIEEVPVSMEIIRPTLIDNKGLSNLEQVVDQVPGVFAMDGQVSIRGGGGYSYGAGSRVMALWNGIPMSSPDVGDIKWNAIPLEQSSQIEIMKGASSVLYGSGALNGIISMVEKEPGTAPEFKAKIQTGIYDNPRRASLRWWNKNPTFQLAETYYGKMYGKTGLTFGFQGVRDLGYRQEETELRGRFNGSVFYRFSKIKMKVGMSYNFQYQDMGVFVLWKSAEEAYVSQDISYQKSIRLNVDPYVKFIDKKNNTHYLRTRYYLVSTGNSQYVYASAKAEMYYADYQFQKSWKDKAELTLGLTNSNNVINSSVFKDHNSFNLAMYGQSSIEFGRFDLTGGMRLEYFQMDTLKPDSEIRIGDTNFPLYPVFRAGTHYAATESTHLRASVGQGVRFPSVAERFVATSNGSVVIVPSPLLQPERGWSAEVGVKQVFKISDWKAMLDLVGFVNEYNNMIEYTFGVYDPYSFRQLDVLGTNPNQEDLESLVELMDDGFELDQLLGFQAQNTERARITGVELSLGSSGSIKEVEINSLLGYTYMDPVNLNKSEDYAYWSSDSTDMLKYRFNHLVKADIESTYRNFSVGFSSRYSSYMRNIDKIFEEELPGGTFVLPGLKEYRQENEHGNLVFDIRCGYKFKENYRVGLIVNNILNTEYASRPGDIQAPRNFVIQFHYHIQ